MRFKRYRNVTNVSSISLLRYLAVLVKFTMLLRRLGDKEELNLQLSGAIGLLRTCVLGE